MIIIIFRLFSNSMPHGDYNHLNSNKEIMRRGIITLGFFMIVLIMIAGCSSQVPSRTSSSASVLTTPPVPSAQSVSHDIKSIQTLSKDGTSMAVSIDRITSIPGPNYNYAAWIAVNYTFTNTGTSPLKIPAISGGIITDYPHKKQCSDARTCNTTYFSISFIKHNSDGSFNTDESYILYPGVPWKVTSITSFDKNDYETLKQGGTISFYGFCTYSIPEDHLIRCYEGWNEGLPSWKLDFAKDVTIVPAK